MQQAIVVFTDGEQPWILRLLRRGFRHCAVMVETSPGRWVAIHPMANQTCVEEVTGDDDPLASPAADRRLPSVVLLTTVAKPIGRTQWWRPYSCVEECKRVLGRHWPWVLTPWQLYRRLVNEGAIDAWN